MIRREDMDIRDIPMAELTKQYLRYVDEVIERQLELASDYLLMSATLIEIKSNMLLPKPDVSEQEDDDPRAELVQRLITYSRICAAAQHLMASKILGRDRFRVSLAYPVGALPQPKISSKMLQLALLSTKERQRIADPIIVTGNSITIREAMAKVFIYMKSARAWLFSRLISGKRKVTQLQASVYFLGILQMCAEQIIRVRQSSDDDFQVVLRDDKEELDN